MRYLVDTNVWIERLLDQDDAPQVERLLDTLPSSDLCITEFGLNSIGVILDRLKRIDTWQLFVTRVMKEAQVKVIGLEIDDLLWMIETQRNLGLDFDDAYQYTVADKYNLTIVSFDSHFDRTPRGRKTPAEI